MTMTQSARKMFDRHYDELAKADCNTCNVGTWAINRQSYRKEGEKASGFVGLFRRLGFGRKSGDRKPSAPGEQSCVAPRIERSGSCKILVLTKNPIFSEAIMNYAVEMASKTATAIVALNLDEHGHSFAKFQDQANEDIGRFQRKATDLGLHFSHMVAHGAEDQVVAKLHAADPHFRYVMNDMAADASPRRSFPVYTRATLRAK